MAPELLARRLQCALSEVLSIMRAHPELEYDERGSLVGSGLTLVPTAHQFHVQQHTLFTWCAWDALTYPVELHVTAHVTSHCPVTGRTISLLVTPEEVFDLDPQEAQISLVVDGAVECCHHAREEVCNDGHFFHSEEAALYWQATHPMP